MKREIPSRIPRVLPLVRHRDHVGVVEVSPLVVAAGLAPLRRRRLTRVAVEPILNVDVVKLLRPNQTGECLSLNQTLIG